MSRGARKQPIRSGGTALVFVFLGLAAAGAIVFARLHESGAIGATSSSGLVTGCTQTQHAYASHLSSTWVSFSGTVRSLLPDDTQGLRHQRFIVACTSRQTLLVVNDIDIGTRVPVAVGDRITVRGQYIWNDRGGLVHWTHHDPEGGPGGWIRLRGKVYALPQSGQTGFPMMMRSSPA